jgi:hypothetical protein
MRLIFTVNVFYSEYDKARYKLVTLSSFREQIRKKLSYYDFF